MNWSVDAAVASAHVTLEELHVPLNHTPYPALRNLVRKKSIRGLPTHVPGPRPSGKFCEDCVNGKPTRAPRTKLAARAKEPLARVFTDVHGPVDVQSRRGNRYWVTFVDDYSRFPAVYFVRRELDVVGVFKRYRAWAENAVGLKIRVPRDDKVGEYISGDFDRYLADAGISLLRCVDLRVLVTSSSPGLNLEALNSAPCIYYCN